MLLARLYRIFLRYADRHVAITRPGCDLRGSDGVAIGHVEKVSLFGKRLVVEGWAEAEQIGLRLNQVAEWENDGCGTSMVRRFAFDVPFETGTLLLLAKRPDGGSETMLPTISQLDLSLARGALLGRFVLNLIALAPEIWRWKRRGDFGARETIKERLGLVARSEAGDLNARLLPPSGPMPDVPRPYAQATLILPVYNSLEFVREALRRIEHNSDLFWRLVIIEDCSTDPSVRHFLQGWCADPVRAERVILILNQRNVGFVGAANQGFEAARAWPDDPIVLVNSDAFVPAGWLSRLLAPMTDPTVASVTPLSNDAEIFTIPAICTCHDLVAGVADAIDASVAARISTVENSPDAPTGVGFCMALAPQFVAKVGTFDPVFGRGYGEENDWCRRAMLAGGRHVAAQNLFVEHCGGISFGRVEKQRLIEHNVAIVNRRWPNYETEVQDFIRRDPLVTARLAHGLAWSAQIADGPVPVYLAHSMGGGAEADLSGRIAGDLARDGAALVLRVGQRRRFRLELHTRYGTTAGLTDDADVVTALVEMLPSRRVIYSCGVGDRDPLDLPDLLLTLAGHEAGGAPGEPQPIEILLHDYFPISPSYTLLGQDGLYRGVPRAGGALGDDLAHTIRQAEGGVAGLDEWQTEWGRLLAAAERITAFSEASASILTEVYSAIAPRVVVEPHSLTNVPRCVAPGVARDGLRSLGVLGNIGAHKGASICQELSRQLTRTGGERLVVIGELDPDFQLTAPSTVHGSYRLDDLPSLVNRYGIIGWFIPSIWPETFSFTSHEALATGLPVYAFDLGAQGAAVRQAANGHVLPLELMQAPDLGQRLFSKL